MTDSIHTYDNTEEAQKARKKWCTKQDKIRDDKILNCLIGEIVEIKDTLCHCTLSKDYGVVQFKEGELAMAVNFLDGPLEGLTVPFYVKEKEIKEV